jgi:hypothetical protein
MDIAAILVSGVPSRHAGCGTAFWGACNAVDRRAGSFAPDSNKKNW